MLTLAQVEQIATYTVRNGGAGTMLWSLHKAGSPSATAVAQKVCTLYGMFDCTLPLPM